VGNEEFGVNAALNKRKISAYRFGYSDYDLSFVPVQNKKIRIV